jgi:hypothetical protein
MMIASATSRAFFFLPIAADLYRHYMAMRELAADQAAIAAQGVRWPLAKALYSLAASQQAVSATTLVAQVLDRSDAQVLNARFDALLGEASPYPLSVSRRRMRRSLLVATGFALLLLFSYAAHGGLVLLTVEHWLQGFC